MKNKALKVQPRFRSNTYDTSSVIGVGDGGKITAANVVAKKNLLKRAPKLKEKHSSSNSPVVGIGSNSFDGKVE